MKTGSMQKLLGVGTLGLALWANAAHAGDFNISLGIGGEVAPGVYGRVGIDNSRYPSVIFADPVVVARPVRYAPPVYLHVPPGHARRWSQYCGGYGACGTPVYFVRSPEYRGFDTHYIPATYVYRGGRYVYQNSPDRYERYERYERHEDRHHRHEDKHRWREERHERKWHKGYERN